jgi:membrane protein
MPASPLTTSSARVPNPTWTWIKLVTSNFWKNLKEQNTIFMGLVQKTLREYTRDQGPLMGAAMVYYMVLSIAPLILLLLSIIGFTLRFYPNGSVQQLFNILEEEFGPQLRNALGDLLATVKSQAITVSGIGLIALILGGSSAFRFLSYSFRKIWRPTPKPAPLRVAAKALLRDHAAGVIVLLAIVGLLSISMLFLNIIQIAQSVLVRLPALQTLRAIQLQPLASIVFGTIVLLFVYRYLPPTRLPWRDVWLGALLAAVLWEAASTLLRLYFDIRTSIIYGLIGSILIITIWVYTMCQVLFLGAEFCKVYGRWHRAYLRQRGLK